MTTIAKEIDNKFSKELINANKQLNKKLQDKWMMQMQTKYKNKNKSEEEEEEKEKEKEDIPRMGVHPFLGEYPKVIPGEEMRKWARMRYSELIYNAIIANTTEANTTEANVKKSILFAKEIERGQYNYCLKKHPGSSWEESPDFVKSYKAKIRTLSVNLQSFDTEYKDLVHALIELENTSDEFVVSGSVEYKDKDHAFRVYDLAFMHYMDLQPWMFVKNKQRLKEDKKGNNIPADEMPDGAFECSNCKRDPITRKNGLTKKTTYYQLQTRSADEPMTNFHTCHNCGKHWKSS